MRLELGLSVALCVALGAACAPSPGGPAADGGETNDRCGDGAVTGAEACDDANTLAGDGCDATCAIEPSFNCAGAPSLCSPDGCGDGALVSPEVCDDGNRSNGDGCSAACTVERGNSCQGSPSICAVICSDGVVGGNETCEDGNATNGDGCSDTCTTEPGHFFEVEPNDDGAVATNTDDFSAGSANGPFSSDLLIHGKLMPAGDDDVFAVQNPRTTPMTVRADTYDTALGVGVPCSGAASNTELSLRDGAGAQLAHDADRSATDVCAGLTFSVPAGGTLYLQVFEFNDNDVVAGYLLKLNVDP